MSRSIEATLASDQVGLPHASPSRAHRRRLRVPFVQQLGADDCGAACLAMVLGAHGIGGAAAECRRLCDAGRDGTRVRTLVAVADRFGLAGRAVSVDADALGTLPLPAIAHWKSRHFVVVEQWTPRRVVIVDPAQGRRSLHASEFAASFTGTAAVFHARADIARRPVSRVPLWVWYLAAMFRDARAKLALAQVIVGSLVLQAAGLAVPLFTKLVVDDIAPHEPAPVLTAMGLAMIMVVVGKTITTFARSAVMIRLQSRLDRDLTEGFFDHLLRLPFRFFQGRSSGDLLMRLSSNTMIREILTTQLLSLLLDGPFTLVYLAILIAMSPSFAAVVAGLALVQVLLVLVSLRPLRDLGQRTVAAKSDEQSCLVELMKGIAYIKASGAEDRAYDRWVALFRRQLGVFIERSHYGAKLDAALGFVRSASPMVLLWYGALLVLSGELPLGTMLALTALAAAFLTPVMSLVQNAQQLQMLDASVERLSDVLAAEPERAPVAAAVLPGGKLSGRIDVSNLSYRFGGEGPLVVDDVSFSVTPGKTLGIVGPTGSGKSTLLMLLLGLHRPTLGDVYYDGVPLAELDARLVRRSCGVVMQDSALFGGSLRSNIALSAPDATTEQLDEVTRLAGLDGEIARLPMGYETRLAESATNLSGGQRQRVAVARALVSQPSILLLDEASSHLDVESEARLNAGLSELQCTRIIVAHRLSAVRRADEILVMQSGRVVERGTHDALMRASGAYAALAMAQGPGRT
jgi:ABC-type bacteriocin/lantibiotic exporter with double-glycine peptidase domain